MIALACRARLAAVCRCFREAARLAELPTVLRMCLDVTPLWKLLYGLRQRQREQQERQGQAVAVAAPYGSGVREFWLDVDVKGSLYMAGCLDILRNLRTLGLKYFTEDVVTDDGETVGPVVLLELPVLPCLEELHVGAILLNLG